MQSFALQSSHLNGAQYDEDTGHMAIQFVNGAVYHYQGVPLTVVDSFRQSSSAGGYFHEKIKGRYGEVCVAQGVTKSGRKSRRRF
jgi:hypothetical protein